MSRKWRSAKVIGDRLNHRGQTTVSHDSKLRYRYNLECLGKEGDMLGAIFRKAGYIRSVLVHLFRELWRAQCTEYGNSQKGVKI
jgi:hypothetical protein